MQMHRRALLAGAAFAALAACSPEPAEEAPQPAAYPDPASAVAPLYQPYLVQASEFPAFRDQAPWSAELWGELEAMAARSNARNEPILNFDPVIGAQDYQLSALDIRTEAVAPGQHAIVRVNFTNFDRQEVIVYDLVWEEQSWRVDNIRGRDWNLREIAEQSKAEPAAP